MENITPLLEDLNFFLNDQYKKVLPNKHLRVVTTRWLSQMTIKWKAILRNSSGSAG